MLTTIVLTLVFVAILACSPFYKKIGHPHKSVGLALIAIACLTFPSVAVMFFTTTMYIALMMLTYAFAIYVISYSVNKFATVAQYSQ